MTSISQKSTIQKVLDIIQPFWIGGLSGMIATSVIQPVDMIKTVIQLKSESIGITHAAGQKANFFSASKDILSKDGIKGFYRGLDSALMRQVFYTTTRMGIYKTMTESISASNKLKGQKNLSFLQKAYSACTAGFVGALFANPADLALVRMQADNQLPQAQRRNYKNVFDAFGKIIKQDGVLGLWRGAVPTVVRAVVLNLAMLVSYDEAKQRVLAFSQSHTETLTVRMVSSCISGIVTSFSSLPFDNAKTKLQKMQKLPDGTFPYKNIFDALGKTISREGFSHLWVGYPTFYLRIAPHVCITLILQDFITDQVKRFRSKN